MGALRRQLISAIGAGLIVSASWAPQAGQARGAVPSPLAQASLAHDIDRILADPRLDGAGVGVLVRDARSGEVLYAHRRADRLVPGSNAKLVTSVAAMEVLGPDYRFETSVDAVGRRVGPLLSGDLHLRGGGDPTMQAADYDALAARVAELGVRTVTGRLVADDTAFDARRLGSSWGWDDEPFAYAAQVSALTVAADPVGDAGSITVETRPGSGAGGRPQARLVPDTPYVTVLNQATTGPAGSAESISVERRHGTNTILVTGSIPAGSAPTPALSSVWEPTGYAAAVFRDALSRHGVRVLGMTATGATPASARPIASRRSMPLSLLLTPWLKLSNNGIAEVLTKAMGRAVSGQGTWPAGVRAVTDAVRRLGADIVPGALADGSGLTTNDLLTPSQISDLLIAVQSRPWFPIWFAALPVAGMPDRLVGGTLASRMRGTRAMGNVHAKTGTLNGVSALSGYVTDADGEPLVFSIMENNLLSAAPKDLEDAIAIVLAGFSRSGTGVAPHPTPPRAAPAIDTRGRAVECSWIGAC
jgi:D-alanyl-D-alanine carboxypeptidase/D-alanyl-D-alanine-endopeptidase (penicillin-binding protein 4)